MTRTMLKRVKALEQGAASKVPPTPCRVLIAPLGGDLAAIRAKFERTNPGVPLIIVRTVDGRRVCA